MRILKEQMGSVRSLINRLKTGTILSRPPESQTTVPDIVIDKMRADVDPSAEDPQLASISSPYEYARQRLNKIWRGREAYEEGGTPVSQYTTLRGALTLYWTSEKWKQAWLKTGTIAGLSVFTAQNFVWSSEAMARVTSDFNWPNAGIAAATGGAYLLSERVMHALTASLKRGMAAQMTDNFKRATFAEPDTIYKITSNKEENSTSPDAMPDNLQERMAMAPAEFAGTFINTGQRGLEALLTTYFTGRALYHNSVPVPVLNDLGHKLNQMFPNGVIDFVPGDHGSAIVAGAIIAAYLGVTTPIAMKMGKKIEESNKKLQKTSGKVTDFLSLVFRSGEAIAASKGHRAYEDAVDKIKKEYERELAGNNKTQANYYAFQNSQSYVGYSVIPLLSASAVGKLGEGFIRTQGYVMSLVNSTLNLTRLVPQYADMKASGERIVEVAKIFELAKDDNFYRLSGVREFDYSDIKDDDDPTALHLSNVELMHRGKQEAYVRIPDAHINRGEWVHLCGESGCGKSTLIKAIAGFWPHGRGSFQKHYTSTMFYAHQLSDLNGPYTMAEQILYGKKVAAKHVITDEEKNKMADVLRKVGLDKYSHNMDAVGVEGKFWYEILSGGERHKLVLARILYQQPSFIMLDEPTAGLDIPARDRFFKMLKEGCPDATVITITHLKMDEEESVRQYFDKEITIKGGVGTMAEFDHDDFHEPVPDEGHNFGLH